MTYLAVDELVAVAWLKAILPDMVAAVATSLPDVGYWTDNQFVQVTGIGGGSDVEQPINRPVVEVACWARAAGSAKPPWGQANQLAERIRRACLTRPAQPGMTLTIRTGYEQARVMEHNIQEGPRKIRADASHHARYNVEVELVWTPVGVLTL